jgi:hypothetical protein
VACGNNLIYRLPNNLDRRAWAQNPLEWQMKKYNEDEKIIARNAVIRTAVETLTTSRADAALRRRSYVREVQRQILTKGTEFDMDVANLLKGSTVNRWEAFYDSIIQTRLPETLRVAYLCGPNPENDVRVFCDAGVLPENIWAFEAENAIYKDAVISALESDFPFLKIVNGGIDQFLVTSPLKFDIIYLDFCGPLPSRNKKQKTLSTISKLLACHSLNSPGILITNVSLPTDVGDAKGRKLLSKIVATYLYPKDFLENNTDGHDIVEGPISHGHEFSDWLDIVSSNLEDYYGQYITRLIMDQAILISPYSRISRSSSVYRKFWSPTNPGQLKCMIDHLYHFDDDYSGGEIITDPGMSPILWSIAALTSRLNKHDVNYPQLIYEDDDFNAFSKMFLSQLHYTGDEKQLIENLSEIKFYIMGDDSGEYMSESILNIIKNHEVKNYYNFCDLVLSHQIVELLFRQIAVPYHVNVEKTKRWTYTSKETPMFMDMTILDECRYVYDWMPTMDMVASGFSDIQRQLAYRFALDAVAKHRRWYNTEIFFGTAVIDQFEAQFGAKVLSPREAIIN